MSPSGDASTTSTLQPAHQHPSAVEEIVRRYWERPGADVDLATEIYHDDAVLEFPQSGERFEGVATFTAWRAEAPADPPEPGEPAG